METDLRFHSVLIGRKRATLDQNLVYATYEVKIDGDDVLVALPE